MTDCHQFVCDGAGDTACAYCKCKTCAKCKSTASKKKKGDEAASGHGIKSTAITGAAGSSHHVHVKNSKGSSSSSSDSGGDSIGTVSGSQEASAGASKASGGKSSKSGGKGGKSSDAITSSGSTSPAGAVIGGKQSSAKRFDFYCAKASCEKFCNKEYAHHHCSDCKCKACSFCASYKCEQPTCDSWCDPAYKKFHCGKCKCRCAALRPVHGAIAFSLARRVLHSPFRTSPTSLVPHPALTKR